MKIIEDVLWHRDLNAGTDNESRSLRSLVPSPGQQRTVWIADTAQQDSTYELLWVPPYAECNGWDAQPSEIAHSQIVTACLTRTEAAAWQGRTEYLATISARISLPEACRQATDTQCDAVLLSSLRSHEFWGQVHWSAGALIGGLTFLDVSAGEAELAMLLLPSPGLHRVRYLQLRVGGVSYAALGNWPLDADLNAVIERQIADAVPLRDMRVPYLLHTAAGEY